MKSSTLFIHINFLGIKHVLAASLVSQIYYGVKLVLIAFVTVSSRFPTGIFCHHQYVIDVCTSWMYYMTSRKYQENQMPS